MKIRRIDHLDLLNHAQNFKKRLHRLNNSQIFHFSDPLKTMKSERSSFEMRMYKQKTQKKQAKQNIAQNQDSIKILALYEKIKFIYSKLTNMYMTNQVKLSSLLVKHIKIEYYIFSKEILQMIRNFRLNKENFDICYHNQPKKILHELNKFRQFLQNFYQKKCLKQIQIIEDNILMRQQAVRYKTPFQKYKRITKSFRPSLITNNIDISEQFRQMSSLNGSFKQLNNVENSLFKKLRQTQNKISRVFQSVCNSRQKGHFLLKIQDFS